MAHGVALNTWAAPRGMGADRAMAVTNEARCTARGVAQNKAAHPGQVPSTLRPSPVWDGALRRADSVVSPACRVQSVPRHSSRQQYVSSAAVVLMLVQQPYIVSGSHTSCAAVIRLSFSSITFRPAEVCRVLQWYVSFSSRTSHLAAACLAVHISCLSANYTVRWDLCASPARYRALTDRRIVEWNGVAWTRAPRGRCTELPARQLPNAPRPPLRGAMRCRPDPSVPRAGYGAHDDHLLPGRRNDARIRAGRIPSARRRAGSTLSRGFRVLHIRPCLLVGRCVAPGRRAASFDRTACVPV